MQPASQTSIDLPGIRKLRSGKVREVFDLCETLLFVATDRLSAFDVVLPDPIPHKGAVLNQLSAFWFRRFDTVDNHFVTADFDEFPKELQSFREQLAGRSMIVRKTKPLPAECVVRGYLAGSGWKEYRESQSVCGIKLLGGLQLASQLPEPIFTPATKSESVHDLNIGMDECRKILGDEMAERVRELSLQIYSAGRDHAAQRGTAATYHAGNLIRQSGADGSESVAGRFPTELSGAGQKQYAECLDERARRRKRPLPD